MTGGWAPALFHICSSEPPGLEQSAVQGGGIRSHASLNSLVQSTHFRIEIWATCTLSTSLNQFNLNEVGMNL